MTDQEVAAAVREAVAALNKVLGEAARHQMAVTLRTTSHQTSGGVEQVVVEPRIFKQL